MSDLVRVERKGRVTTVILNRPASQRARYLARHGNPARMRRGAV